MNEVTHSETGERLFHYEWVGQWWCERKGAVFDWGTGIVECPHCGDVFEVPR